MTETSPQRVPPIKLLGPRRSLRAAGWGALIGLIVALGATAFFWGQIKSDGVRKTLLIIHLVFGLIYGPLLTLLSAARLVVAGFVREDLTSNWIRVLAYCVLGGTVGLYSGLVLGSTWVRVLHAGDLIIFMFVMIGGVAGVLIPGTMVLTRAARRRLSGLPTR
jgi:hypothetical protein